MKQFDEYFEKVAALLPAEMRVDDCLKNTEIVEIAYDNFQDNVQPEMVAEEIAQEMINITEAELCGSDVFCHDFDDYHGLVRDGIPFEHHVIFDQNDEIYKIIQGNYYAKKQSSLTVIEVINHIEYIS